MKKYLIVTVVVMLSYVAQAQFLVVTDNVSGQPLTSAALKENKNHAYLYDEPFKGKITLADQSQMDNVNILYDVVLDYPIMVDGKGTFLKLNIAPLKFELTNPNGLHIYKLGYPPIERWDENSFYEVLEDGKATLLKKFKKSFTESIPYGTKDVVRQATIIESYYLVEGQQIKKVNKTPKAVISAFLDLEKKQTLLKELTTIDVPTKNNEKAMIAFVKRYNSSEE